MENVIVRILLVEGDRSVGAFLQDALGRDGYRVEAVPDTRKAFERLKAQRFQAVVMELHYSEDSALQLIQRIRMEQPEIQVIGLAGNGMEQEIAAAIDGGAFDCVAKPVDTCRLRHALRKALAFGRMVAENQQLRERLRQRAEADFFVGESERMRWVRAMAREIAASDVSVLIHGEAGSGKELLARSIHQQSARAAKPFIEVNCAAVIASRMPDGLFGAGGEKARLAGRGRLELAAGGTLFLEALDELPAAEQDELLQWLQQAGERVDARVIATSEKPLRDAVQSGRFLPALHQRLHAVTIPLPPLRERTEDIPLLVESFLEHFAAKHHRGRKLFTREALACCERFSWPGNVRELRNVVERAVLTTTGVEVDAEQLPAEVRAGAGPASGCEVRAGMSISECERLLIQQTLLHGTSNREKAAKLLGISRRTLQYKLKEYGLLQGRAGSPALKARF